MSNDRILPVAGRIAVVRGDFRDVRSLCRSRAAAWALGCLLWAAAPATVSAQSGPAADDSAAAPTLTDTEKLYGLSKIWQEVNYNFAFFDQVPELNWDSSYQAFIPQVLATRSTYEYYRVLQRFVALLRDGHTNVFMPREMMAEHEGFDPGIDLEPVQGRILVSRVGSELQRQLPVGSEIVAVDGVPVREYLVERVFPYLAVSTEHWRWEFGAAVMLQGASDTEVRLAYATPRGQQRELALRRDQPSRIQRWMASNVPRFEFRWMKDRVAYVALNTFTTDSVGHDFEAVLPQLREARGLVIDLRKNGGGASGIGYWIASWLTDDSLATSKWRTREHRAAHKAWGQYGGADNPNVVYTEMKAWHEGTHDTIRPTDKGPRVIVPTVVLQGHFTGSAAEDFLVAVDAVPHFTTVGQPSNGSTGQPLGIALPGGGFGRVVTKRDTYPDGRDFVGIGALPDIRVEPTVEDVRAGHDPVLQRGLDHLRQQIRR
jgi:carboxyl-terminal processing protease